MPEDRLITKAGVGSVLLLSLLICGAGDAPEKKPLPKSPAVREAAAKAERARKEADAAWTRAVTDAKWQQLADLKVAQKAALERNDLDDATAIAKVAQDVQAEIDALTGKAVAAKVAARGTWQAVGTFPKAPTWFPLPAGGRPDRRK